MIIFVKMDVFLCKTLIEYYKKKNHFKMIFNPPTYIIKRQCPHLNFNSNFDNCPL